MKIVPLVSNTPDQRDCQKSPLVKNALLRGVTFSPYCDYTLAISPPGRVVSPSESVDFANIVQHGIQPPLHIHLPFRVERKGVLALMDTDMRKDQRDNRQALSVYLFAGGKSIFAFISSSKLGGWAVGTER